MKAFIRLSSFSVLLLFLVVTVGAQNAKPRALQPGEVPGPLKSWEAWAIWSHQDQRCPTPYQDGTKHLCFWPSRLDLRINAAGGHFDLGVTAFNDSWIPLPGSSEVWPVEVKGNGAPLPVVEHEGKPSVQVTAGTVRIEGSYHWKELPQGIPLPQAVGILALTVNDKPVEAPSWDAAGFLWLKRDGSSQEATKDFLSVKVYALLEDGIPLWLRTEVEIIVSGKSREEDIGCILPEGWKLSSIESPIPVAVDDAGRLKAQVRAGKWTLQADAFRLDDVKAIRYATGSKPAATEELTAFRSRPDFRMVEIAGSPAVDVSQATFPEKWRDLPVYRWDTSAPFRIEERVRGMGLQKPEGLNITRQLWLDESGGGFTFRDRIAGNMQQIWRLDAAPGQDLGSVRSQGEGQLITRNPQNGASGVEVRNRTINFEATGRMNRAKGVSATGWRSDADAVSVTLSLPPGWRLFALFGADWVKGDWLTAWTLLDLFLLLIFSLAIFRLWGTGAALLAFFAFGLSFHEPGAPRYVWLVLLIPLALLRVVPESRGRRVVVLWKWVTIGVLILILVPFVARQVQQTLYPQLERISSSSILSASLNDVPVTGAFAAPEEMPASAKEERDKAESGDSQSLRKRSTSGSFSIRKAQAQQQQANANLFYDEKARIQTGPGVPEWTWRAVSFGWNGPVLASQEVRPILISVTQERILSILRVALLLMLAALLVNARSLRSSLFRVSRKTTAACLLGICFMASSSNAQMPDPATLDTLRDRLLQPSDAYPNAADIPAVTLTIAGRRITMDAEVHVAILTAVPLPGRMPAWSPISLLVDGKPEAASRREDGYLWVALPPGVHHVRVEGQLPDVTDWEWTFQLKPRRVTIDAAGWTVSGVRPDGVPEQQIFFALKQKSAAGEASYERPDLQTAAAVDRHLELGLVWQIHNTVTRLSPQGKAVGLRIPLLPGENVLSANAVVKDGFIEARLGAHEQVFAWESELSVSEHIKLATRADDSWIEVWHLVASPIWNVTIGGLPPIFEQASAELVPVWHPWPGETVDLSVNRPEAIRGATVTVSKASHDILVGKRQRVSKLDLALRCSLGEDFLIDLPAAAEITSCTRNDKTIPVRKDGTRLIVPLQPGEQSVKVVWKTDTLLGRRLTSEAVGLPVESANINTTVHVPDDRWTLWTFGPVRGPAVRFWGVLICAFLAAWALGRAALSPLRPFEWMLLSIGLTQVPLPAALVIVAWLFLLAWRGRDASSRLSALPFNARQLLLIGLTVCSLAIFLAVVWEGLLGSPEMFIVGNGSGRTLFRWYQARAEAVLPRPGFVSISIWWYRLLMLAWALWLAASLIRWLAWAWEQFSAGGCFRRKPKKVTPIPPPVPAQS